MNTNPLRDFKAACDKQDKEEHDIAAALATLIDAITTHAPHDFLEAATRDGIHALEQAYDRPYAELPPSLFRWGRTGDDMTHAEVNLDPTIK